VLLGSIAQGTTVITNLAPGADVASTIGCFRALGVSLEMSGPGALRISGRGWPGLAASAVPLDAGNSGTTIRLLAGLLAGRPWQTTLTGDASLSGRPMARVIEPLAAMGAQITTNGSRAPLTISGGPLNAIRWHPPVPSAQVKSAVMLAGLSATGVTTVEEMLPTRDHSERAFPAFGLEVRVDEYGIHVPGGQEARAANGPLTVPGDPSSAAVWAAVAAALPGSDVDIHDVLLNPRRLGFVHALRATGADVIVSVTGETAGEPVGTVRVRHGGHGASTIAAEAVPDLIDELPVLAARAALGGSLDVSGAAELRVKESDRISALVKGLRALGVDVDERPDGFVVDGRRRPAGGVVDAAGDHRLVMAFSIVGLGATGPTTVHGAHVVSVSYPDFARDLSALTA